SVLEVAALARGLVEAQRQLEIRVADRATKGTPREAREDPLRARALGLGALGPAYEDSLAARRRAEPVSRERPLDLDALHLHRARLALDDADLAAARHERLEHRVLLRQRARDERDRDAPRPRVDPDRDVLEAGADLADGLGLADVDRGHVFLAADLALELLHAVDDDHQPVPVLHALDVPRAGEPADADPVFAVGREVVIDQQPAARAERHPVDVTVLIQQRLRVVDRAVELRLRIADGRLADEPRGRDVLIEERRR